MKIKQKLQFSYYLYFESFHFLQFSHTHIKYTCFSCVYNNIMFLIKDFLPFFFCLKNFLPSKYTFYYIIFIPCGYTPYKISLKIQCCIILSYFFCAFYFFFLFLFLTQKSELQKLNFK